ncbi:MAG: alpha/beta hydrolase [Candidatus Aminicenantes bacterium]|nr:alpha/beta hydrolase [Candidatus Aminicenantes bacterium]
MNRKLSVTGLFLMSTILIDLICFNSNLLSSSHASKGSPQEQMRIPEISTPKTENMIDVGGRKLHCCVYGNASPTVVLVSGLEAPQEYWNSVIPDLAAKTTVVTFDRAGVGKSEIGDLPTHGEQSAKDIQVLLGKLGVPRPCILVGHSYGGSVVRLFASMYPEDVGGLILEDTQHEDVLNELRKILRGKDLEAFEQLVVDSFSAPENPKTEGDYRNMTREQVRKSKPLPRMPFVILTSPDRAKAMQPIFSDEAIEEIAKLDRALNNKLTALIPGGRQIIVEGAGHNIHMDKPEALIGPVLEMIREVREKRVKISLDETGRIWTGRNMRRVEAGPQS